MNASDSYLPVAAALAIALPIAPLGCDSADPAQPVEPTSALVLDYTAYVEGAIQVSGVGANATGEHVAVVTDFEKVLIVDSEDISVRNSFAVQFGSVPEQGSSEAIAFRPSGVVSVLYPEHGVIRHFDPLGDGTPLAEITLPEGDYAGGMAVLPEQDFALLIVRDADSTVLRAVDLDDGELEAEVTLSKVIEVEGLGLDGEDLFAVSRDRQIYAITWQTGAVQHVGTTEEVGEPSAITPFVNAAGEAVFIVCDDDNLYNAEPGPIRLYLR